MNADLKIYQDCGMWHVEVFVDGKLVVTYAKEKLGAVLLAASLEVCETIEPGED
jgi:hypothetical protein